jgi:hypothetical protein
VCTKAVQPRPPAGCSPPPELRTRACCACGRARACAFGRAHARVRLNVHSRSCNSKQRCTGAHRRGVRTTTRSLVSFVLTHTHVTSDFAVHSRGCKKEMYKPHRGVCTRSRCLLQLVPAGSKMRRHAGPERSRCLLQTVGACWVQDAPTRRSGATALPPAVVACEAKIDRRARVNRIGQRLGGGAGETKPRQTHGYQSSCSTGVGRAQQKRSGEQSSCWSSMFAMSARLVQ